MIRLISYLEKDEWNNIVNEFINHDIYYSCEYAISFMENDDGIPYLLYYENNGIKICYPIIEKDIASFEKLNKIIPKNMYFDWNTPYGYGGPLSNVNDLSAREQMIFKDELFELARERNVVSQFIRFHPLIQNQTILNNIIEHTYIKDTIFIDLNTEEDLMVQMDSKNRNLIRKAIKNGVQIIHDKGEHIDEFMDIYRTTMDRDNATSFYYFPITYYYYMKENMSNEVEYFYAIKDKKIIASSIFFYSNDSMHYHLSGNLIDYRTYAPTNLLLYEAANWGRGNGLKYLHLGGGVGVEDSLFHFKKQFNKNGRLKFYIGRNIFDEQTYKKLLNVRKQANSNFDINNDFYIQYRQPKD